LLAEGKANRFLSGAMPKTIEQINSFTDDFIPRCFEHPAGMEMDRKGVSSPLLTLRHFE